MFVMYVNRCLLRPCEQRSCSILCCLSPLHVGTALPQDEFPFACSTLLLLLMKGTCKNPSGIILVSQRTAVLTHLTDLVLPPHLWGHSQSLLLLTLLLSKINLACSVSVHLCVTEVYVLKLECFKVSVLFS